MLVLASRRIQGGVVEFLWRESVKGEMDTPKEVWLTTKEDKMQTTRG